MPEVAQGHSLSDQQTADEKRALRNTMTEIQQHFIPRDFLRGIPTDLGSTRRMLVTMAALYGTEQTPSLTEIHIAQRCWALDQRQRVGRTTVVSILLELQALGAIGAFEATEGGFLVRGKGAAA